MHASETDLLSLLDGELDEAASETLRAHLADCAACAEELRELESLVAANRVALDALDPGAAPGLTADQLIGRARAEADATRIPDARRPSAGRSPLLRAASVAFLLVAAAAAAAIPGSPVRETLSRVADRLRPAPAPVPESPGPSVALDAANRLVVQFAAPQSQGAIEIRLQEGIEARVAATGGSASFAVGSDSIAVDNAGSSASYVVTVPRDLPAVQVRVGSITVFEKSGDDVRALAPLRDGRTTVSFASLP